MRTTSLSRAAESWKGAVGNPAQRKYSSYRKLARDFYSYRRGDCGRELRSDRGAGRRATALRGGDHVLQGRSHVFPGAGLQPAVGVDPQALAADARFGEFQQPLDLLDG